MSAALRGPALGARVRVDPGPERGQKGEGMPGFADSLPTRRATLASASYNAVRSYFGKVGGGQNHPLKEDLTMSSIAQTPHRRLAAAAQPVERGRRTGTSTGHDA